MTPVGYFLYDQQAEEWEETFAGTPNSIPLYTHPVKESYMDEVLNNTLNMERNHNDKAYKELYEVCVKQQAEIETLKTDLLFFQKEKSKEELKLATRYFELTDEEIEKVFYDTHFGFKGRDDSDFVDFARAILRKAQEK